MSEDLLISFDTNSETTNRDKQHSNGQSIDHQQDEVEEHSPDDARWLNSGGSVDHPQQSIDHQSNEESTHSLLDNPILIDQSTASSAQSDLLTNDETTSASSTGHQLDSIPQPPLPTCKPVKSRNFRLINSSTDRLTDEERSDESLESTRESVQKRKVLHELNQKLVDEQKTNGELISKLHVQLDNALTEKEELMRKLNEKQSDLAEVEKIIEEQKVKLKQLEDVESKNAKLTAIAIKLKKELAEVKESANNKDGGDRAIKEQLKQNVSNFNNLQKEYDRLHDEYESEKKKVKSFESDLTLTLKELNGIKAELSRFKGENERLEKKCQQTEQRLKEERDRSKELSSKIIVLNNKLDEERKRTQNLSALEKQVSKLTGQLEAKQSEINEISKKLESFDEINNDLNKIKDDHQLLRALNESLETELNKLRNENQQLVYSTQNQCSEYEGIINEKKGLEESNKELNEQLTSLRQSIEDKDKNFNSELEELRKKLKITEQQLSNKENEFNSYKIKVTKVLNEKKNGQTNEDNAHLQELSSLKKQLNETLECSDQLKNELHSEKQLRVAFETELITLKADLVKYKDDSSKLVIQQNENQNLKKKLNQLEQKVQTISDESSKVIEQLEVKHSQETEQYEAKIRELNEELLNNKSKEFKCKNCADDLKQLNDSNESNDYNKDDKNDFKNSSDNNTDLDSLENTSIILKQKRLSTSTVDQVPDLDYVNPLQEILSQNSSKTVKAELLDQLNELLKESESNNSLLTEQNRLLKEEVRRLERNIERTEITKNLEYFKNILIKFLSFENNTSDGSERTQLVPVLKTILKLSKEEEIKLKDFTTFMQQFHNQQHSNGPKSNSWWWGH